MSNQFIRAEFGRYVYLYNDSFMIRYHRKSLAVGDFLSVAHLSNGIVIREFLVHTDTLETELFNLGVDVHHCGLSLVQPYYREDYPNGDNPHYWRNKERRRVGQKFFNLLAYGCIQKGIPDQDVEIAECDLKKAEAKIASLMTNRVVI